MSLAVLLAATAGVSAAAAIGELAQAARTRAPRRASSASAAALLARLARRAGGHAGQRHAPDLHARLAAAGTPLGLDTAAVAALKVGGAVAGVMLAAVIATSAPARLAIAVLLCAPAAGFLAPDVALARRARRRAERMGAELADVLDLLRVAIEAGLAPARALDEVGRRCAGLLAGELRAAAARMALGATRREALDELVLRCPLPAVAVLAAAMLRADRHGAALAPALEALAADARSDQARRWHEQAARAAPKIQLVVALVLVPAVMLLVGAAVVRSQLPG